MKNNLLIFLIVTTGFFSCKESNKSNLNTIATDTIKINENKEAFSSKDIYTEYKYLDSDGKNILIQNGFPRGGASYKDKNGDNYNYVVFWTEMINETNNPFELKLNFPLNSYDVPSLPGKYFEVLIPADTMTFKKFSLPFYGLTNLESYIDSHIHKSTPFERTIDPRHSSGFYTVILCLTEGAHGTMRTELNLKGQNLFYTIEVDGSKSNTKSIDKEAECGSISLKDLHLQR